MLDFALPLTGVISAFVVFSGFWRRQIVWDHGSWLVLVVGWAAIFPNLVAKLQGDVVYRRDARFQIVSETLVANHALANICNLIAVLVAGALIVGALYGKGRRGVSIFGAAFILTSLIAMASDLELWRTLVVGQPALLIVLLLAATFATPSREGAIAGAAVFALSVAIGGGALLLYDKSLVFMSCSSKCTFAGEIYMATTTHGNTLGLITAAAIPFIWLAFEGRSKWWLIAYAVFNLALSGSRSALVVGLISLVALLISAPRIRDGVARGRSVAPLIAATFIAIGVAAVIPFLPHDDRYLTGRGGLWSLAMHQFEQHPFLGSGLTVWSDLYKQGDFGAAAAYSTHNQWMEVLLLSGLAGTVVFALGVAWLFYGRADRQYVNLAIFLPVAALGVTERPLSFGLLNSMTWVLIALVMVSTQSESFQKSFVHRSRHAATIETTKNRNFASNALG
jgi:O-antigen ligase